MWHSSRRPCWTPRLPVPAFSCVKLHTLPAVSHRDPTGGRVFSLPPSRGSKLQRLETSQLQGGPLTGCTGALGGVGLAALNLNTSERRKSFQIRTLPACRSGCTCKGSIKHDGTGILTQLGRGVGGGVGILKSTLSSNIWSGANWGRGGPAQTQQQRHSRAASLWSHCFEVQPHSHHGH